MHEIKQATRLKAWPSPQDYNEAIQNPHANLGDEELRSVRVHVDKLGLPRPMTGAFASVYRVSTKNRDIALRCFLRNVSDQEDRYAKISHFIMKDDLPYTVGFEFLNQGIRVNSTWFPVLKMEYVDGIPMDEYIRRNLRRPEKLKALTDSFVKMYDALQSAGIAHGDLQHGNILVCGDELRLVDYDGMFVFGMEGMHSNEVGHPNYQLPHRSASDFGVYLDNFSAWVIYACLRSLALDPGLFDKLAGGDDCLLFRRDDFLNPEHSHTFSILENHVDAEIAALARCVRWQLQRAPRDVDRLSTQLPEIGTLPKLKPIRDKAPRRQPISSVVTEPAGKPNLPYWLTDAASIVSRTSPGVQTMPTQAPPPVVPGIPAELANPTPRKTTFNRNSSHANPLQWQFLMLINPLVWWLFMLLVVTIPQDILLVNQGVDYVGTVTHVEAYQAKNVDRIKVAYEVPIDSVVVRDSVDQLAERFKQEPQFGDSAIIRALPWQPAAHVVNIPDVGGGEAAARHKLANDQIVAGVLVLLNLILEMCIWWVPLRHRHLVRNGAVARGVVVSKDIANGNKDQKHYWIHYSYNSRFGKLDGRIQVSFDRYNKVHEKDRVTILYDTSDPRFSTVYEWAVYKATP